MIRGVIKEDVCKIRELLNKDVGSFDEDNLEEKIKNNIYAQVYEQNGNIEGFVVLDMYNKKLKRAEMVLYVVEAYRRRGIGTELYLKGLEYCNNEEISNIFIDVRTEKNDTGEFFINRGFEKWYSSTEMEYEGGIVESDLQLVNYDEKYYEIYKNAFENAFLELRQALGFNPPRDCYTLEELRRMKDNIFLLLDNEEIIGAVILHDNEIDELFINQKYQGQGYGRKLLNFAINYYQKRNAERIFLGVADWNVRGVKLYESCGFVSTKKNSVYRIK